MTTIARDVPSVSAASTGAGDRSARRCLRRSPRRRAAARRAFRRRPPSLGVHARRHAGRARRRAAARRARGRAADRRDGRGAQAGRSRAGRPASARRRGRRRAASSTSTTQARGAACAEALVAGRPHRRTSWMCRCSSTASSAGADASPARTRAQLRRGGVAGLARQDRAAAGHRAERSLRPTSARRACTRAPARRSSRRRPPLVAFNLQLAAARHASRRARGGRAHPRGRRRGTARRARDRSALGCGRRPQVSMNVERPFETSARARSSHAVAAHARSPARSSSASHRAPRWTAFPEDLPLPGVRSRAPRDRERTTLLVPWPRPDAGARPSTAATPPA